MRPNLTSEFSFVDSLALVPGRAYWGRTSTGAQEP